MASTMVGCRVRILILWSKMCRNAQRRRLSRVKLTLSGRRCSLWCLTRRDHAILLASPRRNRLPLFQRYLPFKSSLQAPLMGAPAISDYLEPNRRQRREQLRQRKARTLLLDSCLSHHHPRPPTGPSWATLQPRSRSTIIFHST